LLNRTAPLDSLPAIFRQRRRWARGGLKATAFVYGVYGATYAAHVAPIVASWLSPLFGLGLFAAKIGADAALCYAGLPKGQRPSSGRFAAGFALFETYFYVYLFLVPALLALRPSIRWKGRKL
jgi:cellulose synthase/poly-beta-1,6-N-acetylglucosamine synthase-like glycosyltransferase